MSLRRTASPSHWAAALVSLAMILLAAPAHAWIETTVVTDDVRLDVERSGMAVVSHAITMRIRGGPLRAFVVPGVDLDAAPEGDATVSMLAKEGAAPESTTPMSVTAQVDGTVRLDFEGGKGIGKGTYLLAFKYRTDLAKSGALERDGAMIRVRWLGPKMPNGLDGSRTIWSFPTAPGEPRAAGDRRDGDLPESLALSGAGAFLTTLRRLPDHDELELSRPHVARGEQVAWAARIDPRALGGVNDPKLLPPPSSAVQEIVRESPRERQVFLSVGLGVALLFTALSGIKGRQVEAAAREAGVAARPIVSLPVPLRAIFAGGFFAAGVAAQLFAHPPALGSVPIVLAMVLMAHRTPLARKIARGPGRFLPLSDEEAFRPEPRARDAWLDASTRGGKVALALALAVLTLVTYLTWTVSPYHAPIAALDGLALFALFATGRRAELTPAPGKGGAERLRKIAARLRHGDATLRVVPWARFPQGSAEPDELRLLTMPKTPLRGLTAIELGYAFAPGEGGAIACPQILIRVAEESPAADRAKSLAPEGQWVAGRRAGELVLTLEPRLPTWRATAALLATLLRALAEPGQASKAASASGKRASAAKGATTESPRHATEAACSA